VSIVLEMARILSGRKFRVVPTLHSRSR
jgi:hypothetical protein